MASGHANRANRPNTWLHRPATQREENPCQLGAVHTWHKADQSAAPLKRQQMTQSRRFGSFAHSYSFPLPATSFPEYIWLSLRLSGAMQYVKLPLRQNVLQRRRTP